MFFGGAPFIALLFFPVIFLVTWNREKFRNTCTYFLHRAYPTFVFWMRFVGLIAFKRITLPADLPRDRAYMLIANHPTIIDVIFCLSWFRGLTTTVKASHVRGMFFGPLVRSANYVPGPGMPGDEILAGLDGEERLPRPVMRMVEHLKNGHPLVVFPEGTRSPADKIGRFQRGPFEAAVEAKAILLPLFIGVDNPGLTKEKPITYDLMTYTFEWMPWIDCANMPEGTDGRTLRNRYDAIYRERWAAFIAARDAARTSSSRTVDERAASALPADNFAVETRHHPTNGPLGSVLKRDGHDESVAGDDALRELDAAHFAQPRRGWQKTTPLDRFLNKKKLRNTR